MLAICYLYIIKLHGKLNVCFLQNTSVAKGEHLLKVNSCVLHLEGNGGVVGGKWSTWGIVGVWGFCLTDLY